jgi:hypothetical protein
VADAEDSNLFAVHDLVEYEISVANQREHDDPPLIRSHAHTGIFSEQIDK